MSRARRGVNHQQPDASAEQIVERVRAALIGDCSQLDPDALLE
jgi:hypothetical protein